MGHRARAAGTPLGDLSSAALARLAKYNPHQPRIPSGKHGGQWKSGGGAYGGSKGGGGGGTSTFPGAEKPSSTFGAGLVAPQFGIKGGKTATPQSPTVASDPRNNDNPDDIATYVNDYAPGHEVNGIPFAAWDPPQSINGWANVAGQRPDLDATPLQGVKGKSLGAGVIVQEPDGRIWVVEPTNHYGGYQHTFPKGTQEPGLSLQATAIKETWEESGLKIEITGVLGDFERTTSVARMYIARRTTGDPSLHGWESQSVKLAPLDDIPDLLNMAVDQQIIGAFRQSIKKGLDGAGSVAPPHPRNGDQSTSRAIRPKGRPVDGRRFRGHARGRRRRRRGGRRAHDPLRAEARGDQAGQGLAAGRSDQRREPSLRRRREQGRHRLFHQPRSQGQGAEARRETVLRSSQGGELRRGQGARGEAGGGQGARPGAGSQPRDPRRHRDDRGGDHRRSAHDPEAEGHPDPSIAPLAGMGVAVPTGLGHLATPTAAQAAAATTGATLPPIAPGMLAEAAAAAAAGIKATPTPAAAKAGPGMLNLAEMPKTGDKPGGSAAGGMHKDAAGKSYVIKGYGNDAMAANEVTAARLYNLAGVATPDMHLVALGDQYKGGIGVASGFLTEKFTALDIHNAAHLTAAQQHFAVDAWLANWDTVGLSFDNIVIGANGQAIRIDPGGSLLFRAMGGPKGAAFGDKVGELQTLRDKSMNPTSAKVFGPMTGEQIHASAQTLAGIKDADIRKVVMDFGPGTMLERDALASKLINRKHDLLKQVEHLAPKAAATTATTTAATTAAATPTPTVSAAPAAAAAVTAATPNLTTPTTPPVNVAALPLPPTADSFKGMAAGFYATKAAAAYNAAQNGDFAALQAITGYKPDSYKAQNSSNFKTFQNYTGSLWLASAKQQEMIAGATMATPSLAAATTALPAGSLAGVAAATMTPAGLAAAAATGAKPSAADLSKPAKDIAAAFDAKLATDPLAAAFDTQKYATYSNIHAYQVAALVASGNPTLLVQASDGLKMSAAAAFNNLDGDQKSILGYNAGTMAGDIGPGGSFGAAISPAFNAAVTTTATVSPAGIAAAGGLPVQPDNVPSSYKNPMNQALAAFNAGDHAKVAQMAQDWQGFTAHSEATPEAKAVSGYITALSYMAPKAGAALQTPKTPTGLPEVPTKHIKSLQAYIADGDMEGFADFFSSNPTVQAFQAAHLVAAGHGNKVMGANLDVSAAETFDASPIGSKLALGYKGDTTAAQIASGTASLVTPGDFAAAMATPAATTATPGYGSTTFDILKPSPDIFMSGAASTLAANINSSASKGDWAAVAAKPAATGSQLEAYKAATLVAAGQGHLKLVGSNLNLTAAQIFDSLGTDQKIAMGYGGTATAAGLLDAAGASPNLAPTAAGAIPPVPHPTEFTSHNQLSAAQHAHALAISGDMVSLGALADTWKDHAAANPANSGAQAVASYMGSLVTTTSPTAAAAPGPMAGKGPSKDILPNPGSVMVSIMDDNATVGNFADVATMAFYNDTPLQAYQVATLVAGGLGDTLIVGAGGVATNKTAAQIFDALPNTSKMMMGYTGKTTAADLTPAPTSGQTTPKVYQAAAAGAAPSAASTVGSTAQAQATTATLASMKLPMPDFGSYMLDASKGSNQQTSNKKINAIKAAAEAGNINAILGLTFGTNSYNDGPVAAANAALQALGHPAVIKHGHNAKSDPNKGTYVAWSGVTPPAAATPNPVQTPPPAGATAAATTTTPPKPKPVFKPENLPKPPDFFTLQHGKPLSSKPEVNAANNASVQALHSIALTGNIDALKAFNPTITQEVGGVTIAGTPSKHVEGYKQTLISDYELQLNPPAPYIPTEHAHVGQIFADLDKQVGFEPNPKQPAKKLGYYAVLGETGILPDSLMATMNKMAWGKDVHDHTFFTSHKAAYNSLNQTEKTAIYDYTGGSYGSINAAFRGTSSSNATKAAAAQSGLMKSAQPLPAGLVLSRKIDLDQSLIKELEKSVGKAIQEPSISSTSIRPTSWSGNVQLRIHIGEGARGLYVGSAKGKGGAIRSECART